MLCCVVLCCFVLFCFVLFCFVLFCVVLFCVVVRFIFEVFFLWFYCYSGVKKYATQFEHSMNQVSYT